MFAICLEKQIFSSAVKFIAHELMSVWKRREANGKRVINNISPNSIYF